MLLSGGSTQFLTNFRKNRENLLFLYFWVMNRFLPLLAPKSHFRWFGVPQTLTLPFKLEDTGSNFGGSFDGDGRPLGALPSLKIRKRSDEKWGEIRGPNLGF